MCHMVKLWKNCLQICCDWFGPAGQKGAIQAAKLGKSVILIEKDPFPGALRSIPGRSLQNP